MDGNAGVPGSWPAMVPGGSLGTPSFGTVTVNTTAGGTVIVSADGKRHEVWIQNVQDAEVVVFIGFSSSLTTSNGLRLPQFGIFIFTTQSEVRGIVAAGSADVRFADFPVID